MASIALLTTKLLIPAPCPNLVPRPQLLLRLSDGLKLGHKLTLVSASAGFGKSNLLSEWAASPDVSKSVAWLSLDMEDNSPTRFWRYVIAALQNVLEEVGETAAAVLRSINIPSTEAILTSLLNDFAAQSKRVVLVLDDYHRISNDEIHRGITFLIDHLPNQLHLVIATRADPSLPIARLRAQGQLTEIRGDDLRFTHEEAKSFLNNQMDLGLSENDLKSLDQHIEGWITGFQLAAISMRSKMDKHEFVVSFVGSHYYILEYLIDEVLSYLPKEVLQFLTQTSILTQLSAGLCDRVTDQDNSQVMLAQLYRENLFITALDYEHTWYRYHQLFADVLKNRLHQRVDGETIADLHQRASHWYQENGYLQVAIRHAQEAGDMERVADLAEQAAHFSQMDSWMTNFLDWLELLPEDLLRSRLRLRIYQACAFFFDGQSAKCLSILKDAEDTLQDLVTSPDNKTLQEELSRLIEIVYAFENILTMSMQGKLKRSHQVLLQIMPLVEKEENIFLSAHALEGIALCQYHQGKLGEAASTSIQLIELAGDNLQEFPPSQPLPIATTGYLLLAGIYLDQNKLEEMAQLVERAFQLCRKTGGAKILVETFVMQSRLQQAQGDIDSAYRSIARAERAYLLKESVTRFRLESQKARLNVETGADEEVIQWIKGLKATNEGIYSPAVMPTLLYEVAQLILARLYLKKHESKKALQVLEAIQNAASDEGRFRHMLEILTLQALALQEINQNQGAIESLKQAIRLAEGEGFVRVFIDKGDPMHRLLYKTVDSGVMPAFTKKLLSEFPQTTKALHKPSQLVIEPLSNREIEVLEHLARGLTYRQIAQKMVISLNTVKTHTGNIYSKLGVNNRTQAGIKAKALGLIK